MIRKLTAAWSAFLLCTSPILAQNITLTQVTTPFTSPIGIDHHEPTNSVIVSVYYASGGQPRNFERIFNDGTHVPFSNVSGLTDEIKIATIKSGGPGGFSTGDLFVGNGIDGQIMRIESAGSPVTNPWVSLPGAANGLMRGGLYHDRTGLFGGDLIAVTTNGEVWRVSSAGTTSAAPLASVGTHLEGVVTVPNDVTQYGPLAGKIIAGAEQQGRLYAIDPAGNVTFFTLGVNIEDIDHIEANANFYGVNFGSNRILGAPASQFASMVGDILLTQEAHSGSGLYRLHWDGTSLTATQLGLGIGSEVPAQWEHVTFSLATLPPFGAGVTFCFGDGSTTACPCGNNGTAGHGCENSASTGGAVLDATGNNSVGSDTVVLTSSGELPSAMTVFFSGPTQISARGFGDGLRCTAGHLRRLYIKNAVNGVASAPASGDLSITQRMIGLGVPIQNGETHQYQAYYRDPLDAFCPNERFNASSGIRILWAP